MEIGQLFGSHLPSQAMERWTPAVDRGHFVLDFQNRYLTKKKNAVEEDAEIDPRLDPLSILRNAIPDGLSYTTDN